MRIKEIFPWRIESPIIHLVQPSPTIPLGHEVVSVQSTENGGSNAIFTLAAQRKQRKEKRERRSSNLSCGYISPSLNLEPPGERRRSSFYDLRVNRSMAVEGSAELAAVTAAANRSKSVDEGQAGAAEKRKTSPDFEDILRDLTGESRSSSDTTDSVTSKTSLNSENSQRESSERNSNEKRLSSSESAFFDISLDELEVDRSSSSSQIELTPRKSFSEETFDRNRLAICKQREKVLEKVGWKSKSRTISTDSWDSQEDIWGKMNASERRRVSQMVDDLLLEIYGDKTTRPLRRRSCLGIVRQYKSSLSDDHCFDYLCEDSCHMEQTSSSDSCRLHYLQKKGIQELCEVKQTLQTDVKRLGSRLVKQLVQRDVYLAKRDWHCDWITAYLQANSEKRSEDTKTRFSVSPSPGDSGFTQWQNGMRAVARLPEGIPPQFRKTLWLNLAEKHLASRGVKWEQVEEFCFNEFTNPDDEELGVQIVKDVHRTGCSLFCGVSGKENQALLKRVLFAYARWNKAVGYCQGFNMLAALILQVMGKSEVDSVKVMIYLIEGVLPESYFANNLRGLSVDMAVFRDLLRLKLPALSRHFDQLQCGDNKDSGTSYEPPLTNVFTMQWFLTLFCNCLPQETVLRVWDLIFLEGNHVLLCTALAIWSTLADRILTVESADEFYCIMGVLTREMLEFGLMDANALIKAIVSFNLPELAELREKYLYNITPWTQSVSTVAKRGLRLFYSEEDTDTEEDDEKIAIATAYGLFRSPKKKEGTSGVTSPPRSLAHPDREKIAMDISALTKQYRKLRERQKQAHVILTAACGSQSLVGPSASPAMNHLLMGKFALVNNKGRRLGPPPGSIPPPSQPRPVQGEKNKITISGETLHWKDTVNSKKQQQRESGSDEEKSPESSCHSSRRSSSSSTSTELCDDPQRLSDSETNSLSEPCNPADKTEPSTPLKTLQVKALHPNDIASCKEETEESLEKYEQEVIHSPVELEVKSKEDTLSITPNEDSRSITPEGEEPRRKTSFRIDPEELRQLDRKLSLKIVEIERRKSSAGIESEDLDKVLFSFDRDYIQEGKRTDRDTPSSIPDDRLCCTDDFVCDFEEETIVVPDLITIHKPLKMSSLEECDETKAIELMDDDMDENDLYEEKENIKSHPESLSSDENEDENPFDTKYNFDELFNKKNIVTTEKYFNESISSTNVNNVTNYLTSDSENEQIKLISDPQTPPAYNVDITDKISGGSMNQLGTNTQRNPENHLAGEIQPKIDTSSHEKNTIIEDNNIVQDTHPKELGESSSSILSEKHELKLNNCNQGGDASAIITLSQENISTSADSRSKLERKLAHLLPSMSLGSSFDSNLPDVAIVTSRDVEINFIREKYAKVSEDTTGLSTLETLEPITFPKSLTQNYESQNHTENNNEITDLKKKKDTILSDGLSDTHVPLVIKSCEEIIKISETITTSPANKTIVENVPGEAHNSAVEAIGLNTQIKNEFETARGEFSMYKKNVAKQPGNIDSVKTYEKVNLTKDVSKNTKEDEQVNSQYKLKDLSKFNDGPECGDDNTTQIKKYEPVTKKDVYEEKNVLEATSVDKRVSSDFSKEESSKQRIDFKFGIESTLKSNTCEMQTEKVSTQVESVVTGINARVNDDLMQEDTSKVSEEPECTNYNTEKPGEYEKETEKLNSFRKIIATDDRVSGNVKEIELSKVSEPKSSVDITEPLEKYEIKTEKVITEIENTIAVTATEIIKEPEFGEGSNVQLKMNKTNSEKIISEIESTREVAEEERRDRELSASTTSSPTRRRGSEVALDMILKENLQILSKIQQQSRRKSEICFDSKNNCDSNASTGLKNKAEVKNPFEKEIIDLSRDITDSLGKKRESLLLDETPGSNVPLELSTKDAALIDNQMSVKNERIYSNTNQNTSLCEDEKKLSSPQNRSPNPSCVPVAETFLPTICSCDSDREVNTSKDEYKSDIYSLNKELCQLKGFGEKKQNEIFITQKDIEIEASNVSQEISEGFVNKGFIESFRHSIGSHAEPLVNEDETLFVSQANFSSVKQTSFGETPFTSSRFSESSTDFQNVPKFYSHKTEQKMSKCPLTDDLTDTNDDIEQELRSLDIKPEEILEYDNLKSLTTSVKSLDGLHSYRKDLLNDKSTELKPSPKDSSYKFERSKHTSLDHIPEKTGSRSYSQPYFKNQRAISLDTKSFNKMSNDPYLDDKRKSFVRSSTLDDDNSLYMNSYKSHGRSLIEKGELETLKTLREETTYVDSVHWNNRNSSKISEESASDYKMCNETERYSSYSHVLSRDSQVSQFEKMEIEDSSLSRYKTYSARSISPSRYRFSSASPVRKKLDTQSEPSHSSNVGNNRVKSPSPTCFSSSRSLSSKEDYLQSEVVRTDYRTSKDYKKYSRTESLDLNFRSDWANTHLKKRSESVEISTIESLHEDRKILSPTSPVKFNPFPVRNVSRQPKELGVKLGLYLPQKSDKSPSKRLT